MIGFLTGEVLFSDGSESIIQTSTGLGYQVFYNKVLVEGTQAAIFIAHIIKEENPHHPTHDVILPNGFIIRLTHEPLIEKIISSEMRV